MDANICTATRKDGLPCKAKATRSGLCLAHDPALAEKRRVTRALRGTDGSEAARLRNLTPSRLIPVLEVLEQALLQVHSGDMEPGRAKALATLAMAIVKVREAGEMEEELRRLESKEGI